MNKPRTREEIWDKYVETAKDTDKEEVKEECISKTVAHAYKIGETNCTLCGKLKASVFNSFEPTVIELLLDIRDLLQVPPIQRSYQTNLEQSTQ